VLQYRQSCAFYLVEKLTGNLISVSWAFGPIARLMTMSLYNDLNNARLDGSQIYLSQTVVDDLSFWLWGITTFKGIGNGLSRLQILLQYPPMQRGPAQILGGAGQDGQTTEVTFRLHAVIGQCI